MTVTTGIYGKLPAHGDFLTRNLSGDFVQGWDHWLQRAMASSQERLGESWLNTYLTSPIWRFVLSSGVIDQQVWAGVLMPSVDRVGRYFPFTLVQAISGLRSPCEALVVGESWFSALETVALAALEQDTDIDTLMTQVDAVQPMPVSGVAPAGNRLDLSRPLVVGWQETDQSPLNSFSFLLDSFLQQRLPSYSLWWTTGSAQVSPCLGVSGFLPAPQYFAAMLDGHWPHWGWNQPWSGLPNLLAEVTALPVVEN